jgi:hypothetical protein
MITKIKAKLASFFKKEEVAYTPPWWTEYWNFLTNLPIGTEFQYLGIRMIITRFNYDFNGWVEYGIRTPSMTCEYVDKNGQLHEWIFTNSMLPLAQSAIEKQTHTTI